MSGWKQKRRPFFESREVKLEEVEEEERRKLVCKNRTEGSRATEKREMGKSNPVKVQQRDGIT